MTQNRVKKTTSLTALIGRQAFFLLLFEKINTFATKF
jgi:hypothetical protein